MKTPSCLSIVLLVAMPITAAPSYAADQAAAAAAEDRASGRVGFVVAEAEQPEQRSDAVVRGRGILQSADTLEIRSQAPGQTTILRIVAQGSTVKKGDLLVELDTASLQDELVKQQIHMAEAQAQLHQAEVAIAALKETNKNRLAVAELALKVAELQQKKYLAEGGEFDLQMMNVDRQIAVAEQRLKVAQVHFKHVEETAKRGFVGQKDLEEARLAVIEAEAELETARAEKRLLAEHVRRYQTAALELDVFERKSALLSAQSQFQATLVKTEAEIRARQASAELQKQRLARIEKQIANSRIHAPRDGLVIYATAGQSGRVGSLAIREGAVVRQRQPILKMPDMSRLQLRVGVDESSVSRVRKGQPATVRIDALPDREFQGKVIQAGESPRATGRPQPSRRRYAVLVSIESPVPVLRPGMTGSAEIDVSGPKPQ